EDEAGRRTLKGGEGPRLGVVSPDGRLAALTAGNTIHVFDTSTGQETISIDCTNDPTRRMIFTRDGARLVIFSSRIRWCDTTTGTVIASLDPRIKWYSQWCSLALSADGLTLAVAGHGGNANSRFSLFRLNARTRKVTAGAVKDVGATLSASALSPDG